MNKSEWKLVTDALSGVYDRVELEVDGFEISLHRCQKAKNRLAIMTYVNGQFLGKWFSDAACREGDFLRPTIKHLYPLKLRKSFKKTNKRHGTSIDYDAVIKSRSPFWGSVSAIRKHYEKTFKNIKLKKINGKSHD
jgi:hypothetical protein